MSKFFKVLLLFIFLNVVGWSSTAATDSQINVFHLNNGHKVIIKEIHANPIVAIDTWVKTGSANETEKINGVSHFLEHLMFKGTSSHKNGEIESILEAKGARCNAATSKDFTHYHVTIASDYVDTAIKLHADMLQHPAIPLDEMNKERKVVQEEIRRANDDPKRVLFYNLFEILFKDHPYRMTTLGPQKTIENISRKEIYNYYNEHYTPTNLTTIIVGDVDTKKVLSLLKDNFNKEAPSSEKNEITIKKVEELQKPVTKITKGHYESGYALWGFKGVPVSSTKDSYALDLAASILGGSESSRLYQTLYENLNLVSSIGSVHYSLKDDSIFLISADFDPKKFQQVKAAVLEEINNLKNNQVSEEELNRAKTLAKRSFIYENESVENIAESLGYADTLTGDIETYKKHIQFIDSITIHDIQRVAQRYLNTEKLALTALLPEETEVNLVLTDKKTLKNSTKAKLNNGITLITTENPSNAIISMSIFMKGGSFIEPVPGTANILVKTLMYGTKQRPYLKLIKEIEDAGISIAPSSGNDYFEIKLKATKDEFDKAFEILADIIKNPTFEEKYITKNKDDILNDIKKSRDYPVSIASENFIELLYKDHPYGNIGNKLEENVPSITRNNVVKLWQETFIPENMIISIAGDVNNKEFAQKLLVAFPASGKEAPKTTYNNKFVPLQKEEQILTNKKSEAAWIFMGWPVGNITDSKEYVTLKLIDTILSDGLSSRMHKTFREDQGLAYRVGCSYSPKMDKGHFVLFIGTEPKNIELVKKKFLAEIERLKTEPVSQKELEDNKSKLIGNYALSQETNQNKAYLMGYFEVIDKEFGFNYDFSDLINNVTSEDIIKIANKYFNYPYAISITAPQAAVETKK